MRWQSDALLLATVTLVYGFNFLINLKEGGYRLLTVENKIAKNAVVQNPDNEC